MKFYKYFRASYPKEFRQMNWNAVFSEADIFVNVKAVLKRTNMTDINEEDFKKPS